MVHRSRRLRFPGIPRRGICDFMMHPISHWGSSGADIGDTIGKSVRFNSADSAYFSRTPGSGNRKKWTLSIWLKRSKTGTNQELISALNVQEDQFLFNTSDQLRFYVLGATAGDLTTAAVFRDLSAHLHIHAVYDSANATAADRFILTINNVRQTLTGSTITLNQDSAINSAVVHALGRYNPGASSYLDGYMSMVAFVDGAAVPASSFGRTSADTGEWVPKTPSGVTWGTNGSLLDFADSSGTTSTTLGKDTSGNGNNWTPNNFSVTAGVGNDSSLDTPTNNYCTFSTIDCSANTTVANGGLDCSDNGGINAWSARATFDIYNNAGLWYWEVTPASVSGTDDYPGVVRGGINILATGAPGWSSSDTESVGYRVGTGAVGRNGSTLATYGTTTAGNAIRFAFNSTTRKLWIGNNSGWFNSGNPAAGTGEVATLVDAPNGWFPAFGQTAGPRVFSYNFGQRAFVYTVPSGFNSLCTANIATPTILKANQYADAVPYIGNGATQNVANAGSFTPTLAWLKSRSVARSHRVIDSVRGVANALQTDSGGAEYSSTAITAMNSNGFALQNADNSNVNSETYISWMLRGGTGTVSNTSGSVTSTVSANPTSGVSFLTFTTPAAGVFTVGHGLSAAPHVFFIKNRNNSAQGWWMYHRLVNSTPQSSYIQIDSTNGVSASSIWNNVSPSSTLLTINTAAIQASTNYVAYAFTEVPGFSKYGSFTGNGSSDGAYVHCGFRPAIVIMKEASAAGNHWFIYDKGRDPYNPVKAEQYLNLATTDGDAVASSRPIDFLANGFKVRASSYYNSTGATMIFMAFAQMPFKYARAR